MFRSTLVVSVKTEDNNKSAASRGSRRHYDCEALDKPTIPTKCFGVSGERLTQFSLEIQVKTQENNTRLHLHSKEKQRHFNSPDKNKTHNRGDVPTEKDDPLSSMGCVVFKSTNNSVLSSI